MIAQGGMEAEGRNATLCLWSNHTPNPLTQYGFFIL